MTIKSPQRPLLPSATRPRLFALLALLLLIACGRQPVGPVSTHGSGFEPQVVFTGAGLSEQQRQVFEAATERWSQVVIGDLSNTPVEANHVKQYCQGYEYAGTIDDLLLFAGVEDLDGPGGVVGMAGACIVRADGFPLVGMVVIDSSDVDALSSSGDLYTVVLHELGHVLDLSHSGWQRRDLLDHDRAQCMESVQVEFTGNGAMEEYQRMGGSGRVPVENNSVPGTACSHWDYETFHSELMTGYLSSDARLSRLTVGALGDMGYLVDMDAADSYSLEAGAVRPQSLAQPVNEQLLPPPVVIDEAGKLVPESVRDGGRR